MQGVAARRRTTSPRTSIRVSNAAPVIAAYDGVTSPAAGATLDRFVGDWVAGVDHGED